MDVISFLVALAGVLPGIAAWWTGRGLLIHLEDPALPELLLARRQRLTAITAVVLAAMIVLGGRSAYWGIPLLLVSLPVGGYALR
jgi:hypothetical protein